MKCISMLRGINVSGQKRIKMKDLKTLYESIGFSNVITYIQSGNVIFECHDTEFIESKNQIEKAIRQTLNFPVTVMIRTLNEFQNIIQNNPFLRDGNEDIKKLHVTFLSDAPLESSLNDIETVIDKSDEFVIDGREIYILCNKGYGRTKLTNSFFERKLNVSATTRNWKTVYELYTLSK